MPPRSLSFPRRAPSLNASHPASVLGVVAAASVASGGAVLGSGGMTDLVSGVFAGNTTLLGGVNENGPFVKAEGIVATSVIGWPIPGKWPTPVSSLAIGLASIIKVGTFHSGQNVANFNNGNTGITGVGATFGWGVNGVQFTSLPVILDHTYFVYGDGVLVSGGRGFWRFCVMDMTTGILSFIRAPRNLTSISATGNLQSITAGAGLPNEGTIATTAHLLSNPTAPTAWLSDAQIMAWARDPYSLWYGPTQLAPSQALTGKTPASTPPPPIIVGGNSVALTTAHPIPWRRVTPLHKKTGARSARTVYQPGTVPLVTQRLKMTYTAGMPLDRVVGFKLTVDNGTNGFTFTLRDRNTGDRFVFTHSGGHATNVAGSIATLSTECDLAWVFDGPNDSVVTLAFANIEFHPGHL